MTQPNKWSPRNERRVEDRRREEVVAVAEALAGAHEGEPVAAALDKMSTELQALWTALDAAEDAVEGAKTDRATWRKRALESERALKEAQARVATLEVAERRANKLQGDLADARREVAILQRTVGVAAQTHRAQPMPADQAWVLIRQQSGLRSTVAMMRPELLQRDDAGEVRRLCTLLGVAAEGAARAAALEDLRAALVRLRTRAARDSLSDVQVAS